jgi:flagellar hook assembly protein FlgD
LIDQVSYSEKWHFKLIDNDKGVALERIDFNKPSQDASNWHSAATSMGYGTPTYQNSQFMNSSVADGNITLIPQTFSPDNDGYNDFITVTYNFPEPGYVCNIILYDLNGRAVKYLTRNALCGLTGYFRWDGLDEKNNKLPVGIYIMISEIFNLKGKTKKFKNGIVLAKKLT